MGRAAKLVFGSENKIKGGIRSLKAGLRDVTVMAKRSWMALKSMGGAAMKAFRSIRRGGLVAAAGIAASVREAHLFAKQMAEVQTMTNKADISGMSDQVRELSGELGMAKDELSKGLYNALSAGVPADNAIEFLRVASRAAIAGVSDVATSVDALSTVVNAYGIEASEAGRVSDILFAAVRGGKTTFGEIAAGLGDVVPVAAQAGISFEDIAAAIATATTQGMKTDKVYTGIRAAIVGILKPSDSLAGLFQRLGTSGEKLLRTRGLQRTLQMIGDAAGGSTAELVKFLPNVRALPLVMTMIGSNAAKATKDVDSMVNSLGAADKAFRTMDNVRTWEKAWQSFRGVVTEFGEAINTAVGPHIERLAGWFGEIASRSDVWETMTRDLTAFANVAVKNLTTVKDLIKDIFAGGQTRKDAFSDIGEIIKSAWRDAMAIAHNELVPLSKKIGRTIGGMLYDILPKWARGKDPRAAETIYVMKRGRLITKQVSPGWNDRANELPVDNMSKTMDAIRNRMAAQDTIARATSAGAPLFSKSEVERMQNFLAPPEAVRSRVGRIVKGSAAARAGLAGSSGDGSIMGTSAALGFVNRSIDIGEVFTRLMGQGVPTDKKARIMADGSMMVHVTNQGGIA